MPENDSGADGPPRAWVVSVEVDGRQRYLFETDKLQEMVGASAIMRQLAGRFDEQAENGESKIHVFQPASGEIRAWSENREALLHYAWKAREWLTERGVEHTVALLECRRDHFICDKTRCEEEQARRARKQKEDIDPDAGAGRFPSEPEWPDLSWVHGKLTDLARQVKNAKPGSDARPVCSLFEACRLHGFDFANEWIPQEDKDEPGREKRRALRGYRASRKWRARQDDRTRFVDEDVKWPLYERSKALLEDEKCVETRNAVLRQIEEYLNPDEPKRDDQDSARVKRAIKIDDLVLRSAQQLLEGEDGTDRFVAFICADGDGMGRLLAGLDWNTTAWNNRDHDSPSRDDRNPNTPWERNRDFSRALDNAVRDAFRAAVAEITLPDRKSLERFLDAAEKGSGFLVPVLPQLLGGDDLWTIARRDVALKLCRTFASNVSTGVENEEKHPVLQTAMDISKNASGETVSLSMSLGIAFAKAGHPVHAMIAAAESLLESAKTLRKGTAWTLRKDTDWKRSEPNEGCIDWHWIESSLSETVGDARARGAAYIAPDTGDVMLLTTRPWTLAESEAFEKAAVVFESGAPGDKKARGVPRRKREQLEDILRRGHVLSLAAWEAWWAGLHPAERCAVKSMSKALPQYWSLPAPGCKVRAGPEAPKWRKHLDLSPWIHLGPDKVQDGKEKHYYVTPLIDLLTLHNLGSSTGSGSDQPGDDGIGEAEGAGEAPGGAAGGTHG